MIGGVPTPNYVRSANVTNRTDADVKVLA